MHPAKSVIGFTTLSGAGYGLMIVLFLGAQLGLFAVYPAMMLWGLGTSFVLVTCGLLLSTFHLGHPERAWRAFSQWRSSWLSREGVMAVLTYLPLVVYSGLWFFDPAAERWLMIAGLFMALGALTTVYTTSMIYRSLKPIQAWYNRYVSPLYLLLGITSGLILLNFILQLNGIWSEHINFMALFGLLLSQLVKVSYWRFIDSEPRRSTIESATGLGHLGSVRSLEHPHSHANYLMQEMGFKVARKHSAKLRRIFLLSWVVAAFLLLLPMMFNGFTVLWVAALTLAATAIGIFVERWLFFAEARHDQALYYGG